MEIDTESDDDAMDVNGIRLRWFTKVNKLFNGTEQGMTACAVEEVKTIVKNISALFPDFDVEVREELEISMMMTEAHRSRNHIEGVETLRYYLHMIGYHLAVLAESNPETYGNVMKGIFTFKSDWKFDNNKELKVQAKAFADHCQLKGDFSNYFTKCIQRKRKECFEIVYPIE